MPSGLGKSGPREVVSVSAASLAGPLTEGNKAWYSQSQLSRRRAMPPRRDYFAVEAYGARVHGATSAVRVRMAGYAKVNSSSAPYTVQNEHVCGLLGLAIGLPIPPGTVVMTDRNELAYVALQFGHEDPPPAEVQALAKDEPFLAAGVVAFDCWIGNEDRHDDNLSYVHGLSPLEVFDQGDALWGKDEGGALARLAATDDPMIGRSCLAPVLPSVEHVGVWADRIAAVPKDLIEQRCKETVRAESPITAELADAGIKFLRHRQTRIMDLIRAAHAEFPMVEQWGLL
jgi:hypothetical protein